MEQQRKTQYNKANNEPLDLKITKYITYLQEGWGRNYARALAGLRCGRKDYLIAMDDPRVKEAHKINRLEFLDKQRGKFGNFKGM